MSSIRLKHASGNSMSLAAPGTNPASNLELKLPHTIGSANQLLKVDANGQLGWADDNSGLSLSNDANNRVVTGTGSGLNAEANLTFDGSVVRVGGTDTYNASDKMTLVGSSHTSLTIDATSATYASVYFADGSTGNEAYRGWVQYQNDTDKLVLGSAATTALTLDSSQNATFAGEIIVSDDININADNKKLNIGASADLQLYHTGADSIINDNGTGSLRIAHNGNNHWEFGDASLKGNDGRKLILGDSSDLQLFHDGNSNINHTGAGDLFLNANTGSADIRLVCASHLYVSVNGNEAAIEAYKNGGVYLYNDGVQMLNTYGDGVIIGTSTETDSNLRIDHENSGGVGRLEVNAHGSANIQLVSNFSGSAVHGVPDGNFGLTTPHSKDIHFCTAGTSRMRIDAEGHIRILNESNSARELRWYNEVGGSAIATSIGWGNGNANWEFKHFRNDNQANNPYANIDFFTGAWSTGTPTRALRITNDGNHIREKHSRFATRIDYNGGNEAANSKIPFMTPHVNVGSDFDSSNERYVAPVDGDYAFWFHTNVARSGAGNYYATWKKNGSEVNSTAGARMYDQHSGSGWNNLSGCLMINLDEGDYIEIFNGGVAVNYDGGNYGQWMGWLVG